MYVLIATLDSDVPDVYVFNDEVEAYDARDVLIKRSYFNDDTQDFYDSALERMIIQPVTVFEGE